MATPCSWQLMLSVTWVLSRGCWWRFLLHLYWVLSKQLLGLPHNMAASFQEGH